MKRLNINLGERSYDILIGQELLGQTGKFLSEVVSAKRVMVVTHPSIRNLYGDRVLNSLESAGFAVEYIDVPEGEKYKSLEIAGTVYDRLMGFHCDRTSILVALGGGVIGDLTGFIAATYMRGIPFIQIPTTLLAQVDSSVGGKTAVNHPKGKNMIGAFYQPRLVLIDLDTLKTLPKEEFRPGLAEVVKYGVILDPNFFEYLEAHVDQILDLDPASLEHIIEVSCATKAQVVERDERESRYRMILNFGHTLGHAIEALTNYRTFKHGEAVAIGMVFASHLSAETGRSSSTVCQRIAKLVRRFGLPAQLPDLPVQDFVDSMYHDKKTTDQKIKFILAKKIGSIEIVDEIPASHLEKALKGFREISIQQEGIG